jgi:hypothetical protein
VIRVRGENFWEKGCYLLFASITVDRLLALPVELGGVFVYRISSKHIQQNDTRRLSWVTIFGGSINRVRERL